jgi:aspartyl-tRNA(Asn)/glutamyl-tRNA(Gln) amidotransferase subunit B
MHDHDAYDSLIDLNRCGVPLLEIVTEPDIRTAAQAGQYLTELRRLLRYLEICDGNMEEGSMRCDANISVRKKGSSQFGTKVEVKNMNSIRHVQKAIEHEYERQIAMLESGEVFSSETRSFDAGRGNTFALRSKEQANDYRYFPEPDLQPLLVSAEWKTAVHAAMPPLPAELFYDFTTRCGLSDYDAGVLTEFKEIALFYNRIIRCTQHFKAAANWVMGPVKSWLNANALPMKDFPLSPECLAQLTDLVEEGKISYTAAVQKLFPALLSQPSENPVELASRMGLQQVQDSDELSRLAQEVLLAWPEKVAAYRSGKKGMIGLFMGELMKKSGGKADPKIATRLLEELLEA